MNITGYQCLSPAGTISPVSLDVGLFLERGQI